jgi:excisionase family DNA binding protein
MDETETLLTPPEAAKLLRVPVSWIYERTRRDAIPLRRLGKYTRIPQGALLQWVEHGCPERWEELSNGSK